MSLQEFLNKKKDFESFILSKRYKCPWHTLNPLSDCISNILFLIFLRKDINNQGMN